LGMGSGVQAGGGMSGLFPDMRADEVLRGLRRYYGRADRVLFLAEVKTGATWFANNLRRFDALTIKKSWTDPCVTGYEIKVSRADFLGDEKWPNYLENCHRLYFACPKGMIKAEELDAKVGLVWVNEQGGVSVRKKAPFRDIELPVELFYHLVISHLGNSRPMGYSNTREYCEAMLQDKEDKYHLGRKLGTKMAKELHEARIIAGDIQSKLKDYKSDREELENMRAILKEFGISWRYKEGLREKLALASVPGLIDQFRILKEAVDAINIESKEEATA